MMFPELGRDERYESHKCATKSRGAGHLRWQLLSPTRAFLLESNGPKNTMSIEISWCS